MNITDRTTHDVQQGTGDWLRLREGFDTASEAPAAQGVSRYVTRAELLRRKHTGVSPEPDAGTLGRFADGHAAEAKARPLAEGIVGGELYPVTMTAIVDGLPLLASLDGLDLAGDTCWETKLWNEELAECVRRNDLPEHYTVQMDQELLVSGASRCLFTCTDGTPERLVSCWYEADPAKFAALVAGWRQFRADLAAYTPPPITEPARAEPMESLPAVAVRLDGALTVAGNLPTFAQALRAFIDRLPKQPATDNDFATVDAGCKALKRAEEALDAAEAGALASITDVEAMRRAVADCRKLARDTRLAAEKLVERRKIEIKEQAVAAARRALDDHIGALNAELAPMALRPVAADFAAAIKGLRSIASMQDALDTTLAGSKILADGQARSIRANMAAFKAATGDDRALQALFADLGQLAHKAGDDFAAVLDQRITKHRADEAAREAARKAAEDARIAAAAQAAREQAEREAQARIAEQQRQELERQQQVQREALAQNDGAEVLTLPAASLLAQDECRPLSVALASKPDAPMPAREAVAAIRPAANEPATLKLGDINARLAPLSLSVQALAELGVAHSATDKAARLYRESDWLMICSAIVRHVKLVSGEVAAA